VREKETERHDRRDRYLLVSIRVRLIGAPVSHLLYLRYLTFDAVPHGFQLFRIRKKI
jgi:hypothetical protein